MAFLNSAALLNMGADAVKTASASQVTPDAQANGSDEFAQALRKQMQQGNKPAIPAATSQADAPKPAVQADKAPSAPTPNNSNTVKNDDGAPKASANQTDEQKQADSAASESDPAQAETTALKDPAVVSETPQERKKRLLADIAANDPLPTGISPWMQTMIAMRPTASDTSSKIAVASDNSTIDTAVATTTDSALLSDTAANTLAVTAESADKTTATPLPTGPAVTTGSEDTSVDFKQLLADTPQASVGKETTGLPETLANAKLIAESGGEAGRAAAALGNARSDAQADLLNLTSQPAAQALPNSQWLSAAGVAQTSSVAMSQIAAPFGNERWQTAMNQHVMNMVGSGDDVASLTLSPPDLGPIQVVLKVDNQSVNTSFITDNPSVRQALEDGMQDLRDRMQSQGLQLGQTFVGDGQQAQQHFEQQTARQGGQSQAASGDAEALAAPQTAVKTTVARGLVDTFV